MNEQTNKGKRIKKQLIATLLQYELPIQSHSKELSFSEALSTQNKQASKQTKPLTSEPMFTFWFTVK